MRQPMPLKLWRFYDAPPDFQKLSPHGGDEDWVLFIHVSSLAAGVPEEEDSLPEWIPLDRGRFGCCSISRHAVEDGLVYIGAHA